MKVIDLIIKKHNLTIENPTKFAFDNLDKLICNNNDTLRMQDSNTILKYAIDTGNHDFIRSAIFIKKDGKNICNPYIDFKHRSPMDVTDPTSEKESLVEFIDKLLNEPGMGDFHDFGSIRHIRGLVRGCIKK